MLIKELTMEYKLVTRSGETIKKVRAESMEIAIEFFCGIKNLKPKELLSIYDIKIIE